MKTRNLLLILVAFISYNQLYGQDKSNDTTARYFIIQASIGNQQEIATAKLAEKQATSPEVKAFAQQMIADHGKAEAQLMEIIKTRGFDIPANATDTPVEDMMLKNASPNDFDRLYIHMMVPDHRQTPPRLPLGLSNSGRWW